MICNFCEIDDIQGSRLDFDVRMWYNTLKDMLFFRIYAILIPRGDNSNVFVQKKIREEKKRNV